MAYNLSPECIISDKAFNCFEIIITDDDVIKEPIYIDRTNEGILVTYTKYLVDTRQKIKDDMVALEKISGKQTNEYKLFNQKQLAIKVMANSLYGILT